MLAVFLVGLLQPSFRLAAESPDSAAPEPRAELKTENAGQTMQHRFSPDGALLATFRKRVGGFMNSEPQLGMDLIVWDVESGKELVVPSAEPPDSVFSTTIAFTHSGNELFVWPQLWDIEAAAARPVPESFDLYLDLEQGYPSGSPAHQSRFPKKRAKILDGKIIIWDLFEGERIAEFLNPVPEPPINASSQSAQLLASQLHALTIPWAFDNALAFTSNVVGSGAATIDVWKTDEWKIFRSFGLDGPVLAVGGKDWTAGPKPLLVRVAKDDRTIVVLEAALNANDKQRRCTVTAYDLETGQKKYRLDGHNDFVSLISLSPNSQWIATGSGSDHAWAQHCGEVQLWDMASGELVHTIIDQGRSIHCLAFDHSGDHLAIGRHAGEPTYGPEVSVWRTSTGAKLYNLQLPALESYPQTMDQPHSLAFAPDNRLLAVGGGDRLSLWEMPSGKFRYIGGAYGPIHSIGRPHGDRQYLSERQRDDRARPWDGGNPSAAAPFWSGRVQPHRRSLCDAKASVANRRTGST